MLTLLLVVVWAVVAPPLATPPLEVGPAPTVPAPSVALLVLRLVRGVRCRGTVAQHVEVTGGGRERESNSEFLGQCNQLL